MKNGVIALTLFTATAVAIGAYPLIETSPTTAHAVQPIAPLNAAAAQRPVIDVVFVLDTTGSMGGMIAAAKEKIWSIAASMAAGDPAPAIRMGLVAYRDRGDAYVTRVEDLSSDMDSVYATLMELRAEGGGDGPESVNQALDDALHKLSWSQHENAYKVVFLVGDAPPHMDYDNERRYPELLREADGRDIVVNAVQCGESPQTRRIWQQIAALGGGTYFRVDQQGGALALDSPFDEQIAALSAQLDATRLYYGDQAQRARQQRKMRATRKLHDEASAASRARRATYNLSRSGAENFLGENELVDGVSSGRVALEEIDSADLPAPMQAMAPGERKALIVERAAERDRLRAEIETLSSKRESYLADAAKKVEARETSLDHRIQNAVREQAAKLGIHYDKDDLRY
ncbi:MAG: VWA domain-containing protein [Gammaproteobacteria bacterium]|nr:VWA domain-containing protein [Gammaproteobacteria bacterium]